VSVPVDKSVGQDSADQRADLRVLTLADLPAALRVAERDPVANVFVLSRLLGGGLSPTRGGAEVWGYSVDGALRSLLYVGANVVPVQADAAAVEAFAARATRSVRRCSSIVGPADAVLPLWERVAPVWGPAREVRRSQPLMSVAAPDPAIAPDPAVRAVARGQLDVVMPACVAMFTEEVGVSPLGGDGGLLYRCRIAELVESGRAFARIEDDAVLFKAEIGAATSAVCQVQGVWVEPTRRGQGLAAPGVAAVVDLARAHVAPTVSLYVNDFNTAALATYRRVGFRQVGTFASVLF
jgi:predicted GNAT family acetyltransferase